MRSVAVFSALAAANAVGASPTATLPVKPRAVELEPITATGNAFFKGKERFYIRGVDYQPGGSAAKLDPLADTKVCMPDIERFKKLGINVIRVYMTDNTKDHDECMNALAEAGIYVMLDANNPTYSIAQNDPEKSYNTPYLQSVFATIDAFAKYTNVMGFFSGNEVIHDKAETTKCAPFVKATTRDMRAYIKARGHRKILVGYSAADVSTNARQTADYFNCGADGDRSDFFAINDYSWCSSNFITAGWDKKVEMFKGLGLPLFLSEYGCITNKRDFAELESLMHPNMTGVYSGGLMYEYTYEDNKFGIVEIEGGGTGKKDQTGTRKERDDFDSYANALKKWPAPSGDGGYTSTTKAAACPTADEHWLVTQTSLPNIPEGAKAFFTDKNGAGPGPGLDGPGSQSVEHQGSEGWDGETGSTEGASNSGNGDDKDSAAVRGMPSVGVSVAAFVVTLVGALAL